LWDAVKDSRDVNDFKAYLNKFPNGLFAELASNRVRTIALTPFPQSSPNFARPTQAGAVVKDCAECPEMVVILAGSFNMGSNQNRDEQPIHRVNVTGFLLGRTEVTQGQWNAVMGGNQRAFGQCGGDCPVEKVTWYEAQEFARRLSQKTDKKYRLPSEAEWEYAARAGSTTKWSFGDKESQLVDHAWYSANSQGGPHRAAGKHPNAFGLHDMHGNVWEWVEDCWHENYYGAPTDGRAWTAACSGGNRVLRGGSWGDDPSGLHSAYRYGNTPANRGIGIGLRLARNL
jgi:formylglycine-generating enzyme required for sulfatase activity